MTDELSVYRTVCELDTQVFLVQHCCSKKLYVKKTLSVYSRPVYDYLLAHPIPNMPQIFALSEEEGSLTVIEEYLCGDTLQFLLDQCGTMKEDRITELTLQLCTIVQALHEAEPAIIHRDIKPENILISPDGVVKLLDMNAAKQYAAGRTQDTRMIGTVGFAAPEQYGFRQSGVQTDIYAIGAVMNVLLTGDLPANKAPFGRLAPVIRRCTELSPEDRYPSVAQLRDALRTPRKPEHPWQRYLLPGIRSLEMPKTFFAAGLYALFYYLAFTLEVSSGNVVLNRLAVALIGTLTALLGGNYLGILEKLPITKSRSRLARLIGFLLYEGLTVCFLLLLLAVLGG